MLDLTKADMQRFAGKTVLLAGGAGFLGRHFVDAFAWMNREVLPRPCRVLSVDNHISSYYTPAHRDLEIVDLWADIGYPLPLTEDINFIIHAAGLASPVYYKRYPLATIAAAVHGTMNLADLARENSKSLEGFLFFSSSEIYGDPDAANIPTPETYHGNVSSVGPRACYDESKRLGETICTVYQEQFGVPATIVRPFNVFGPGMAHNDRRVIPMFAFEGLNGRPLRVHGNGLQTRTFCYVTDALTGFFKVLLHGKAGAVYNIGNAANEITMADLAELYRLVIPEAEVEFIPYPHDYPAGEPRRRCPDLTKAARDLGYRAQVALHDGLGEFVAWAKRQGSYCDPRRSPSVVQFIWGGQDG